MTNKKTFSADFPRIDDAALPIRILRNETIRGNERLLLPAENGAYPPTQNGLIHPQLLLNWP